MRVLKTALTLLLSLFLCLNPTLHSKEQEPLIPTTIVIASGVLALVVLSMPTIEVRGGAPEVSQIIIATAYNTIYCAALLAFFSTIYFEILEGS